MHAEYQRRGIATAIMDRLELYVAEQNYVTIVTHASITAYPFFRGQELSVGQRTTGGTSWRIFEKYDDAEET